MNMNRPDMTEDVKSKDYTNKSLQTDSNPVTMKASKSPATESSDQTKAAKHEPLVYRVEEIAQLLAISPPCGVQPVQHHEGFPGAAHRHQHPGKQAELRQLVCSGLREVIYGIYHANACHSRQKYICAERTLLGIRSMKRGDSYSVRYKYKDHSGKPCEGWESFKTKKEAQERKITVEKELLDGTFLVPDTMTVEEMLYKWIPIQSTKHKWSPKTYTQSVAMVQNLIVPYIGKRKVQELRTYDIEKFYATLAKIPCGQHVHGVKQTLTDKQKSGCCPAPLSTRSTRCSRPHFPMRWNGT